MLQDDLFRQLEPEDVVKAVFQAECGCGHILPSEYEAAQRIITEENSDEFALFPEKAEPLTEQTGNNFFRLNLRKAAEIGVAPEWIAAMMAHSLLPPQASARHSAAIRLRKIASQCENSDYSEKLLHGADMLDNSQDFLPSHSAEYHRRYHPSYRIIDTAFTKVLPVLAAISKCTENRIMIAIDGPCGGGKTTLSKKLADVLGCCVVHTDDYYVPHSAKTPERLSMPGGNCNMERLLQEVIEPWVSCGNFTVQAYQCHTDSYSSPVTCTSPDFLILEGSYSLLPEIRKYVNVPVFITIDSDLQKERIVARDGDAYLQYESKWIPLEQAYFAAFDLPDEGCIVIGGK